MAEVTKETQIARERARLRRIFKNLDENKLKTAQALIDRAAFLTVHLRLLEEEINENGWTEEYKNGASQSGMKKSAAADAHISLTKNLSTIMKQLLELVPPAARKDSKLDKLRNL